MSALSIVNRWQLEQSRDVNQRFSIPYAVAATALTSAFILPMGGSPALKAGFVLMGGMVGGAVMAGVPFKFSMLAGSLGAAGSAISCATLAQDKKPSHMVSAGLFGAAIGGFLLNDL